MRSAVKLLRLQEFLTVTGITRRTLRVYEEVGLVRSSSAEGPAPLYPEEAVETVFRIQRLRDDLGVNLAGVQVILEMRQKIEELQRNLEEVVTFVQTDLRQELEKRLRGDDKALVPRSLNRDLSSDT